MRYDQSLMTGFTLVTRQIFGRDFHSMSAALHSQPRIEDRGNSSTMKRISNKQMLWDENVILRAAPAEDF
jgi:hypothetical protein